MNRPPPAARRPPPAARRPPPAARRPTSSPRFDGEWKVDSMTLDVTHQRGNDYVRDTVPES